ncbi:MAG: ribosome maturation factor RimM [Cytophagales bacterium]|nr:ribosome maturation factor RimM [Cytophagales bacterium]
MEKEKYFQLGIIKKEHGLNGRMLLLLDDAIDTLDGIEMLFIQIKHNLVPYFIESFSLNNRKAIIKLEGIANQKQAHEVKGLPVFVPYTALPETLQEKNRPENIIGYQVFDAEEGRLGKIHTIHAFPQQQLLALYHRDQTLLIPYHNAIVKNIDHKQQSILVHLPSGFLNTFLQ